MTARTVAPKTVAPRTARRHTGDRANIAPQRKRTAKAS
jgi:hypothetical protein